MNIFISKDEQWVAAEFPPRSRNILCQSRNAYHAHHMMFPTHLFVFPKDIYKRQLGIGYTWRVNFYFKEKDIYYLAPLPHNYNGHGQMCLSLNHDPQIYYAPLETSIKRLINTFWTKAFGEFYSKSAKIWKEQSQLGTFTCANLERAFGVPTLIPTTLDHVKKIWDCE